MSFEITKQYTDNPFVDELVYYTLTLGLGTILKMQSVAEQYETQESLAAAGKYISCYEGTAIFSMFDKVTESALTTAGITNPSLVKRCLLNIGNVPEEYRDAVTTALAAEYVENYDEQNQYYRMLNGMPPVGKEDYVTDWDPPTGLEIDLTKPIHEMTNNEALILDSYGILDDMIEEDVINRLYMRHLGEKKVDYYTARRASRFDVLYVPTTDADAIEYMYKEKLDANRIYVLRTVYSEAYKYNSDYYDNMIAVMIILITIVDVISRVQEFITRKEIFDIRSVQYLFKSYGVPFYDSIPLKYQISMVKNLHTLLSYKSTSTCMVDICSIFGFDNIRIYKYYLLKDRTIDVTTGEYKYSFDEDGNEITGDEYELKFLKLPLEEDLDDYVRVGGNYIDYDEITYGDAKWDGELDHDMVMKEILEEEFNFTRTKYISIDTVYDVAKMSMQQTYFFNMLYDNVYLEGGITLTVPYIAAGVQFRLDDLFTLLTVLTYYYNGVKDTIMDTQGKILYVNGFNFHADLAALAAAMEPTMIGDIVVDAGATIHAREQLEAFELPTSSIPSFKELVALYTNNLDVRDELVEGMRTADNKRVYDVYKMLYDSLCTMELTFDYYKDPETGDFYRDEDGDATYKEFLRHRDLTLYNIIDKAGSYDDAASRNQFISNLIDSICWAIEEFIDTDEFSGLFANLPVMSSEAVKQYVQLIINFYKSYKVDFLGMNTIYTYDDNSPDGSIMIIDDIDKMSWYFQSKDFMDLYERFAETHVDMSKQDVLQFLDRVYLDITTWGYGHLDERPPLLRDQIGKIISKMTLYTIVQLRERLSKQSSKFYIKDIIDSINEAITMNVDRTVDDTVSIEEKYWIIEEGTNTDDNYAELLEEYTERGILLADEDGSITSSNTVITEPLIDEEGTDSLTERAVIDYIREYGYDRDSVITSASKLSTTTEEASDEKLVSLKALKEAFGFIVVDTENI